MTMHSKAGEALIPGPVTFFHRQQRVACCCDFDSDITTFRVVRRCDREAVMSFPLNLIKASQQRRGVSLDGYDWSDHRHVRKFVKGDQEQPIRDALEITEIPVGRRCTEDALGHTVDPKFNLIANLRSHCQRDVGALPNFKSVLRDGEAPGEPNSRCRKQCLGPCWCVLVSKPRRDVAPRRPGERHDQCADRHQRQRVRNKAESSDAAVLHGNAPCWVGPILANRGSAARGH